MVVRRQHRQTLLDIAMQYCGDATAAFEIALINDIEITDTELMQLYVPESYNKKITQYYQNNSLSPATQEAESGRIITHAGEPIITHNQENIVQNG